MTAIPALLTIFFSCGGLLPEGDKNKDLESLAQLAGLNLMLCANYAGRPQTGRTYQTGFESTSDFNGFYIVPQNYQNAASHMQDNTFFRSGSNSHKAWIYAQGPSCPSSQNCNHRGYPTIQLQKTAQGSFYGTVFIEFYVYLNMTVSDGQWFSFATMTSDPTDAWSRTVLVNLGNLNTGTPNFVHLMHVPYQGQSGWTYQASTQNGGLQFPAAPQWVKLSICLNFHPDLGYAKVWQNDVLVSSAPVRGGCGGLEQAHFGLYAIPSLSSGTIYNDDLVIQEVSVCPK